MMKNFRWRFAILNSMLGLLLMAQPVLAKDDLEQYVKDHFDDLYKKYNSLEQQSLRFLELQRQIEDLRNDNRALRTQIEDLQHTLKDRPQILSPAPANPATPATSPAENLPGEKDWDRQTLAKAKVFLRSGDSGTAIKTLEPLTASKVADVAVESQYWLGLAYVTQKDCGKGMIYLKSFLQLSPDHALAPESLLAYGICQKQLGDAKGYQDTLTALKTRYPLSAASKNLGAVKP